MLLIPLTVTPNQTFNIILGGQNCLINVAQKSTGVFVTVSINTVPIIQGAIAIDRVQLVREPYLGFIGDLAFFDQLSPYTPPDYTGFNGRYQFVYLEASDL